MDGSQRSHVDQLDYALSGCSPWLNMPMYGGPITVSQLPLSVLKSDNCKRDNVFDFDAVLKSWHGGIEVTNVHEVGR